MRLLQAKSKFGKVVRGCGVEFTKIMTALPPDDLHKAGYFETKLQ